MDRLVPTPTDIPKKHLVTQILVLLIVKGAGFHRVIVREPVGGRSVIKRKDIE